MGNKPSLTQTEIQNLRRKVSFTDDQIKDWHIEYLNSCRRTKGRYLTVAEFKEVYAKIYGGDARDFAEHIFRVFDTNGDNKVDFQEFLIGLSVSASDNTEKKLRWAFNMYDIDGNGYISRDEMLDLMESVYRMTPTIMKPPDVATPELMTNKLFKKLDENGDKLISFEEFKTGAIRDPLVLSMLQLNPEPSTP